MNDEFTWEDAYRGDGTDPAMADPVLLVGVADLTPGTALDLGCGAGGNAIALAQRGWRVTGIDLATTAIASATISAGAAGVHIDLSVANATTWVPPHPFDLVVSNYALPARPDRDLVLATAVAAVAPGGTLFVTEWAPAMAPRWALDEAEFVTLDELVAAVGGLTVERAAIITVDAHDHGHANDDDAHGALMASDLDWLAVAVRARRPFDEPAR